MEFADQGELSECVMTFVRRVMGTNLNAQPDPHATEPLKRREVARAYATIYRAPLEEATQLARRVFDDELRHRFADQFLADWWARRSRQGEE